MFDVVVMFTFTWTTVLTVVSTLFFAYYLIGSKTSHSSDAHNSKNTQRHNLFGGQSCAKWRNIRVVMADFLADHEIVSKFLLDTCCLRQRLSVDRIGLMAVSLFGSSYSTSPGIARRRQWIWCHYDDNRKCCWILHWTDVVVCRWCRPRCNVSP